MNNNDVAKRWREQAKFEGHSQNMFYEYQTIYSYGHHFPMATLTNKTYNNKPVVFVNSDRYSVTTSKHQGYVYRQIWGDFKIEVSTKLLDSIQHSLLYQSEIGPNLRQDISVDFDNRIVNAIKRKQRSRKYKDSIQQEIDSLREQKKAFLELFND